MARVCCKDLGQNALWQVYFTPATFNKQQPYKSSVLHDRTLTEAFSARVAVERHYWLYYQILVPIRYNNYWVSLKPEARGSVRWPSNINFEKVSSANPCISLMPRLIWNKQVAKLLASIFLTSRKWALKQEFTDLCSCRCCGVIHPQRPQQKH